MTPRRWIALGFLTAAVVLVQARCLDTQPEVRAERIYSDIGEMPPGDVIPTYVASLFFGSFRALAIDFLWIQLKRIEEEKRWYERREIIKLISYFQPRNLEVWAMLGWHSAYNVANSFSEPERGWEWVEYGLKWLREGIRKNPHSPYLKFELAWTLHHKPSWREGRLDLPLLSRIESDPELQKELSPGRNGERALSSFEIAMEWYAKAREEIARDPRQAVTTQMGLVLSTLTCDGMIRDLMYLQGMYDWKMDRHERAKEWFARAADHTRKMQVEHPGISPIFRDIERFYGGLPRVVDLEKRARSGRPEDERAYLEALQKLVVEESGDLDTPDRQFLWVEGDPKAPLNRLKQKAAQGRDPQECNDAFKLAFFLEEGAMVAADLSPEGLDVDFYRFDLPSPRGADGQPPQKSPSRPIHVRLLLQRPQGAGLGLRVTLYNNTRDKLREVLVRKDSAIEFDAGEYGTYFVKVEPAEDARPWPPDTRYFIRYKAGG